MLLNSVWVLIQTPGGKGHWTYTGRIHMEVSMNCAFRGLCNIFIIISFTIINTNLYMIVQEIYKKNTYYLGYTN